MAAETDPFVVGSAALWAGDFYLFERLMKEFVSQRGQRSSGAGMRAPEAFIVATAETRLRQLWQKRGEFRKLARRQSQEGVELTDLPVVLETTHLRATLWRTGMREFLMQAYSTDVEYEDALFANARRVSKESGVRKPEFEPSSGEDSEVLGEPKMPLGGSWVVSGDLFLQVELTDMGLLEASGLWTAPGLPKDAAVISDKFMSILLSLETPSRSESHGVEDV